MVAFPALLLALLIGWRFVTHPQGPDKLGPLMPMTLARVQQLQAQADQACSCAKGSSEVSEKHNYCWKNFRREVARYKSIAGPEAVAACVGWDADDTLTFGPPVQVREEKARRLKEFEAKLTQKEREEGYAIPGDLSPYTDGEISADAPEWTVITGRIHGGCSAGEEKRLIAAKKAARERRIASGQAVRRSCG
jgi:hypothetical protein